MTKHPLQSWILAKIAAYLANKEGCVPRELETSDKGSKFEFQDAFGYVYEVNIKTLSRLENDPTGVNLYDQNRFAETSNKKIS